MKNRVLSCLALLLFLALPSVVLSQWSHVGNVIVTAPSNIRIAIDPDSGKRALFTKELLQILEGGDDANYYPIIRMRDRSGENVGRLGIVSEDVIEDYNNTFAYPHLLKPFLNPGLAPTIAGDLVLTTGRNGIQPNEPSTNIFQNLFLHSAAPMGNLVLSNENGMPGFTTPRILIKPKGEVLFQSNWDPMKMIGNPNNWTPKSDIQFGNKLFMYYWGNTMDFAFNRYWDNPQSGHLRAETGGGGALNFSTTGEFSVSTFCPGPAGSLVQWDGTKTLRMDCNGAVTVGIAHTPNPDFKLWVEGNTAVNGKIKAREVRVTVNSWPDYVFKKDYNLRPLSEVETFIATNGHLPGVLPAQEAETDGIQIGEMQVKLLEKVEELTLYMIELKKENERLHKEVSAQSERIQSLEVQK